MKWRQEIKGSWLVPTLTFACAIHCLAAPFLAGFAIFSHNPLVEMLIFGLALMTAPSRLKRIPMTNFKDVMAFAFILGGLTDWAISFFVPFFPVFGVIGPLAFAIGTVLEHRNLYSFCKVKKVCHCSHKEVSVG